LATFTVHLLGGDRRTAEEIHQETWLAALSGIADFDEGRGEFRGWLFGIARRRVALEYRRRGRLMPASGEDALLDDLEAGGAAILPAELVGAIERGHVVRAALAELGSDSRAALVGKYLDGRGVDEIARHLGRTPKAVESLLSRARERMRVLLRPYFEDSNAPKNIPEPKQVKR